MSTKCMRRCAILKRICVYQGRMASSITSPAPAFVTSDKQDVMAVTKLRQRFSELTNEDGVFPLLNHKQAQSIQKRVRWSKEGRQAAVLVLLCNVEDEPSILFTRRAAHLNEHAAEISFPGGHLEPGETYTQAALRETLEELLPPPDFLREVQVVGHATRLPSIRGTPVTPVLAVSSTHRLSKGMREMFPGNPHEVDRVFSATVADLLRNEGSRTIESKRFGSSLGPTFSTPYGEIWGLTAFILRPILHQILEPVYMEAIQRNDGESTL